MILTRFFYFFVILVGAFALPVWAEVPAYIDEWPIQLDQLNTYERGGCSNQISCPKAVVGFVNKISEANNPVEREAAIKLINRIGMPELQRMATELEKTYQGSGLSGQLRYSILVMMFSQRTMDGQ